MDVCLQFFRCLVFCFLLFRGSFLHDFGVILVQFGCHFCWFWCLFGVLGGLLATLGLPGDPQRGRVEKVMKKLVRGSSPGHRKLSKIEAWICFFALVFRSHFFMDLGCLFCRIWSDFGSPWHVFSCGFRGQGSNWKSVFWLHRRARIACADSQKTVHRCLVFTSLVAFLGQGRQGTIFHEFWVHFGVILEILLVTLGDEKSMENLIKKKSRPRIKTCRVLSPKPLKELLPYSTFNSRAPGGTPLLCWGHSGGYIYPWIY